MPVVSEFFGIKILMFWDEHNPPHFHAEYGGFTALIHIGEGAVLKGALPIKQLKLVLAWCEIHRDALTLNWNSAMNHGEISKIEPLR